MKLADIGVLGLGTMGASIARNAASKKLAVAVYNRTSGKTDEFIAAYGKEGIFIASKEIKKFVSTLNRPRKILLMVTAGAGTDAAIQELIPHLQKGDIIIDGGNAFYQDTARRQKELAEKNIEFVGCGISGGEEGALKGPSMMVGGKKSVWTSIKPIFTKLAARDRKGRPCVAYIGEGGAGHYVKMVHNGIEYGIMQLIAEAYTLLRDGYAINPPGIADIFETINTKHLRSFLLDTAIQVLRKKDDLTAHGFLIEKILDRAGQKGTGMWTSVDALERGGVMPTITEAVFARNLSSRTESRMNASKKLKAQVGSLPPIEDIANGLQNALLGAITLTFIQGYELIDGASTQEKWKINLTEVSRIWQNGCIIRMNLLELFETAFVSDRIKLIQLLNKTNPDMRTLVSAFISAAIPAPAFASTLMYVDSIRQQRSGADMIQGLRDAFGAHTYERVDRKGVFHSDWTK